MYYLNELAVLCTLGGNAQDVRAALLHRGTPVPDPSALMEKRSDRFVGAVNAQLAHVPEALCQFDCRNNRLAATALEQIRPALDEAIARYGAHRVGVVMGTSTTGIAASEVAVRAVAEKQAYPPDYHMKQATLAGLGEFVGRYLDLSGPVSTVSTACSSSAVAILSARRMLQLDLCDAVVVGGVDTLCEMTLQGFGALEALAKGFCAPFTADRDGINIGEAAAIFLMSAQPTGVCLLGGGSSSDAHHISAPHPEGDGAFIAMRGALEDAGLSADQVDYLNMHGTGTPHNDVMECKAVDRLFGTALPCSSTKSMTGHTLGASGALELAFCWLLLTAESDWRLPPSLYLDQRDPKLPAIALTGADDYASMAPQCCMSNSFAFGGNNVSLVVGKAHG
jgi:3-oxoacyl-[acyl-carrier-protein] synthase-1